MTPGDWYKTDCNQSDKQLVAFDSYMIPEADLELGQLRRFGKFKSSGMAAHWEDAISGASAEGSPPSSLGKARNHM